MKSKVEQYAKGNFQVAYPEVRVSATSIQLKIEAGSEYTGRIQVVSENGIPMKMMVYDNLYVLRFNDHGLIGKSATITFTFDAKDKKPGSHYEGIVYLIGNGIEKKIPYCIEVISPVLEVDGMVIEDLMKFCTLAEDNWKKALEVFVSERFEEILLKDNEEYVEAYRSLNASGNQDQALEEFLVYIHKKRVLTLQVEQNSFVYAFPEKVEEHHIALHKNTWGYCKVKISSEDDFIRVHQSELCSSDFSGNYYVLGYTFNPVCLDKEKGATGHITIENTYQKLVLTITIKPLKEQMEDSEAVQSKERQKKLEVVELMHNYLDYRLGVIPLHRFVSKTKDVLHQMISYGEQTQLCKLGLLHMDILAGNIQIVQEEIKRIEADEEWTMEEEKEQAYYLYMNALLWPEEKLVVACETIRQYLVKEKNSNTKLFYFWLLLHLEPELRKDKLAFFAQMQELFSLGCESPVLLLEICELLNEDPFLLKRLSKMELAAISFGIKNNYLGKEVQEEFLRLASLEKLFSTLVFSLLCAIYKQEQKPEVMRVICALLVKGNKIDTRYHEYYLEGIRCGYRIIGIQENYLRSMRRDSYELIPESALRYFNYKGLLTESEYAYLYANVIVNRRHYLNQYEEYLPNMEAFMEEQIIKGAMSDDLSILYSEFLKPQVIQPGYAGSLVNVIFKRKLTIDNDNIVAVIVSHKELQKETVVPVVDHVAYIDLITNSAVITLLDREQNRYISTIPYKLQKIVEESVYISLLEQYASYDCRYMLYRFVQLGGRRVSDARGVNVARDLLSFDEISEEVRQQAVYGIVHYYHEPLDSEAFKHYLAKVDLEYITPANAGEYMDYLVESEFYDKAYEAISRYGYRMMKQNNLIRLVEAMCSRPEYETDEELVSMALYLYRSGYDNLNILSYLVNSYQSGVEDMLKLWKAALGKVEKIDLLEENILCQALYTEQWGNKVFDVFANFVQHKHYGIVIKAFYKRAAFAYLIEDKELPTAFFETLYNETINGKVEDDVLCASVLLYFSRKVQLEEQEEEWVKRTVEGFVKRGILLPFFRKFKRYLELPKDLFVMTYIVTKDKAGKKIVFKYGIQSGERKAECNKEARMLEVLPGYYVREFVLFHGENLLYEMPKEHTGHTRIYESEGMKAKGETEAYENRFELLNAMLLNQETGKNDKLLEKINEYLRYTVLVEENLEIID